MHHILKIQDGYYTTLKSGNKKAEIRFNDRNYQAGDTISFHIIDAGNSPQPKIGVGHWTITHVLHYPEGLKDGWVVLSLKKS